MIDDEADEMPEAPADLGAEENEPLALEGSPESFGAGLGDLPPVESGEPAGGGRGQATPISEQPDSGAASMVSRFGGEGRRADDTGDATGFVGPADLGTAPDGSRIEPNWDRERSTQRIAFELQRIEAEVRQILEGRDPKRKRRLAGTRRWYELEEDILALRFSDRVDESYLLRLEQLVRRRHYLFGRLRFLASTRPTWNS